MTGAEQSPCHQRGWLRSRPPERALRRSAERAVRTPTNPPTRAAPNGITAWLRRPRVTYRSGPPISSGRRRAKRPAASRTFMVTSTGLSRYGVGAAADCTRATTSSSPWIAMGPTPNHQPVRCTPPGRTERPVHRRQHGRAARTGPVRSGRRCCSGVASTHRLTGVNRC